MFQVYSLTIEDFEQLSIKNDLDIVNKTMVKSIDIKMKQRENYFLNKLFEIKSQFPWLYRLGVIHIIAFLLCLIAFGIDTRELAGINVWIKPAKFLSSTFILLFTLGWYLLFYPFQEKTKSFIANSMTFLLTIENILILIQASRGVQSHYNTETFFDEMIFSIMGIGIGLITLLMIWMLVKSFSNNINVSTGMLWGFRIAWFAFLFGSVAGGGAMIEQSAHTVGVPDGGNGLPFLNWSTEGGDLRIAHFLGLHAIQIIPLMIYFIYKKFKDSNLSVVLSIMTALLYLGWIVFTFYQAKAGQPMIGM